MKNILFVILMTIVIPANAQYFAPETPKVKDESQKRLALIVYPLANKAGFEFNFGKRRHLIAEYDLEVHYSRLYGSHLSSNELKLMYAFKNYAHSRVYAGLSAEAKTEYYSLEYWYSDIYISPILGFQIFPSERVPGFGFIGQLVIWNISDTRVYAGLCYRL